MLRYGRTVKVTRGEWNRTPERYRFQWFRNETEIDGATRQTYRLGVADVGQRIKARVYVKKRRYEWAQATARSDGRVGYRVPVRRTVTYRIETRGSITTSVREFAQQAAQTYADPRGWRNAGVAFQRVRGASDFSLVLAEASWLPRFSSVCSVQWSCRAGPLRRHQPDALEVRLTVVERRRQEPARLPPPRRQPRDRPLARPRPPRLPGARTPRAGDDAAVQGPRRLPPQPVAARQRALVRARERRTSRSWA